MHSYGDAMQAAQKQAQSAYQNMGDAPRPATALDNLRVHLDGLAESLAQGNERLKRLCHKAFGSDPEPAQPTGGTVAGGGTPAVQALGNQVELLQGHAARLLQNVSRLEALI